jgi:hypothetical protein
MSRIVRYEVVEAKTLDLLVDEVQGRISLGWQPLGGPFYLNGDHHQAVVWTDESERRLRAVDGDDTPYESEIELIEELTEDDQPISRWEGRMDDSRGGSAR